MKRPSNLVLASVVGSFAGLIAASLVLNIGFRENSQNEFYDSVTGQIEFPYALMFGSFAFVEVGLPVFLIALFFLWLLRRPRAAAGGPPPG
jgi:hypothetical protein